MFNKFILQLLVFVCIFFGTWFLLSKIDFTGKIDFKKMSKYNEQKLGDKIVEFLKQSYDQVEDDSVVMLIDKMKERICDNNKINPSTIKILVLKSSDINAFALPGDNLAVFTGIIEFCNNPEELSSVMAHEIAHIQYRHLMKKLTKEVGISVLGTLAGGNSGNEIMRDIVRTISSTSFDREMEREADTTAVRYLAKANINPENFANLLYRLSKKTDVPENFEWISDHPKSKDRTAEILKLSKKFKFQPTPVLDSASWDYLKEEVRRKK